MIENYKEQMNQLEMQQQYLQAAIADYTKAKITLENLSKTDEKADILLPIGVGIRCPVDSHRLSQAQEASEKFLRVHVGKQILEPRYAFPVISTLLYCMETHCN